MEGIEAPLAEVALAASRLGGSEAATAMAENMAALLLATQDGPTPFRLSLMHEWHRILMAHATYLPPARSVDQLVRRCRRQGVTCVDHDHPAGERLTGRVGGPARTDARARKARSLFPERFVLTAADIAQSTGVSERAARSALNDLGQRGIADQVTFASTKAGRTPKVWMTPQLAALLRAW